MKCEKLDARADYNDISSTALREVMRKETGIKPREALDWMALSADLLWRCRSSWIDKARLGTGCRIKFQEPMEGLQLHESPISYMDRPHYDDPPSLEGYRPRHPDLSVQLWGRMMFIILRSLKAKIAKRFSAYQQQAHR